MATDDATFAFQVAEEMTEEGSYPSDIRLECYQTVLLGVLFLDLEEETTVTIPQCFVREVMKKYPEPMDVCGSKEDLDTPIVKGIYRWDPTVLDISESWTD